MKPPLFLSRISLAPPAALLPVLLLLVALGVPGCSHDGEKRRDSGDDALRILARTRSAVDDPLRPEQDRERDPHRRPAELLGFFGIDAGRRVADLQGTHGYYTEILSTVVGPEGRVYVQNNDFVGFYGSEFAEALAEAPASVFVADGSPVVVQKGATMRRTV